MKKILLGTTMLISAAGLFAGAALAETPKVTVGGYENFEVGIMDDDLRGGTTASHPDAVTQRAHAFRNDTQVDFKIDGKTDNGLGYGGEVDLLADTTNDVQNRGFNASKTFIYLDGMWGRFEMGSNVGADGTMKVDAATIARATGGINGDWSYFANAADNQLIAMASLPLGYGDTIGGGNVTGDHSEENLSKVTYYTPRFAGFQLGVSYLPDQTNRGQGVPAGGVNPVGPDRTNKKPYLSANIFTGGLSYDNKFGDVGIALAATGEWGNAQNAAYEDLGAWNAGAKFSYMGFSIAGSYGDWGKSNTLKTDHSKNSHYWTLGGAYEYGPFGASVTYLDSRYDCGNGTTTNVLCDAKGKDKFTNVSVGVDYKLAPGLTPYAEVSFYDQKPPAATLDKNSGTVGIIGTQLNF